MSMIKLKFILFFLITALVVNITSCCTPNATIGSQPVPLYPQGTGMWCWAASGEMCMNFLGANISQCDEANQEFGFTDCCDNSVPSSCINGGWPQFYRYGFKNDSTLNSAISFKEIQKQIYCYKKPVAFSWHWTGGGGHMMVVTGYFVLDGVQYVTVNDPWAPNVGNQYAITYDDYVSDNSTHTHWRDYYNITKK